MLKKSLILSLFSLLVSLISIGNQLLIAYRFGSSSELDIYLTISGIPLFISGTIVAAFNYSLTPLLLDQENSKTFQQERSSASLSILMFAFVVTILGMICSLPFYYYSLGNIQSSWIFWLTLILSNVCCILNIIGGYLNSVAAASFKFNLPFLASGLPHIFVIISCTLLYRIVGPPAIVVGLVAGNLSGVAIISFYLGKSKIYPVKPSKIFNETIIDYFKRFPLVLAGMLGFTVFAAIDIIWSQSLGESKLAYLSYCQKMIVSIGTLIIAGPSSILTPYLAKQLLEETQILFFSTMERCLRLLITISAFVSVNLFIYAEPITRLMFERGKFSKLDALNVASILPFFGFGMILMVSVVIMFRALMVKKDLISGAKIGLVGAVCYFSFSGVFSHFYNFQGISYAYIATWLVVMVLTIKLLWKQNLRLLVNARTGLFLLKIVIAVGVLAIPLNSLKYYFFSHENLGALYLFLNLSQIFIASLGIYIVLLLILKVEEVQLIKILRTKKI